MGQKGSDNDMSDIKVGDRVISYPKGIKGVVIKQYFPTACGQQTMIRTDDGRLYHASTVCFMKMD